MTDDEIARDRAVIAAVPPGPWVISDDGLIYDYSADEIAARQAFVTAARTRWPLYVAEVERLRAVLDDRAATIAEAGHRQIEAGEVVRVDADLLHRAERAEAECAALREVERAARRVPGLVLDPGEHGDGVPAGGCSTCDLRDALTKLDAAKKETP